MSIYLTDQEVIKLCERILSVGTRAKTELVDVLSGINTHIKDCRGCPELFYAHNRAKVFHSKECQYHYHSDKRRREYTELLRKRAKNE